MKNDKIGIELMSIHKKFTRHKPIISGDDIWCSECLFGTYDIHSDDLNAERKDAEQIWK